MSFVSVFLFMCFTSSSFLFFREMYMVKFGAVLAATEPGLVLEYFLLVTGCHILYVLQYLTVLKFSHSSAVTVA